jgi:hypothetical protein
MFSSFQLCLTTRYCGDTIRHVPRRRKWVWINYKFLPLCNPMSFFFFYILRISVYWCWNHPLLFSYVFPWNYRLVLYFLRSLLAYNSSIGGHTVIFIYVLTMYLRFISSIFLSFPPTPFLRKISQVSFFYFHVWLQNISTIFILILPFLMPTHLPLDPPPDKTYFSLLPFILAFSYGYYCSSNYLNQMKG